MTEGTALLLEHMAKIMMRTTLDNLYAYKTYLFFHMGLRHATKRVNAFCLCQSTMVGNTREMET